MIENLIPLPDNEAELNGCFLYVNVDFTQAFLLVKQRVEEKFLFSLLQRANVQYGVISEAVSAMGLNFDAAIKDLDPVLVAKGDPAINGEDGRIDYLIDLDPKSRKANAVNGKVDYRNVSNVVNVTAGQIIARMIPPTDGEPGTSIYGQTIPPVKGQPSRVRPGKNVDLNQAGEFVAKVNGHAFQDSDRIDITTVFTVNGDLDFSVGNIDFIGDLLITGNVLPDFTLKAGGNITVDGSVDAAVLEAGGNINVNKGVVGRNKCKIKCGGNFSTHFLSEAEVESMGNINVDKEIRLSKILCAGKVTVQKGAILGGEVTSCHGVDAPTLGSPLGVPTSIRVGIDFRIEREAKAIEAKGDFVRDKIIEINNATNPLRKDAKVLATMPPIRRRAIDRLLKYVEELQIKKSEIEVMVDEIKRNAVVKGQEIICRNSLNEDVELVIGLSVERRFRNVSGGRFVYDPTEDQISCKPLF